MSGALQGTLYAFVLVSAPSLRMLWRLRESLLALPPLVLALAWTIGLMHLFGIRFNLATISGLPMILGISAEFGLNVMFRYLEGRAYGGPLLARSTVLGVVLNGLIKIVGFGSLLIAAHRGIFSLGLLITIGCACGLVGSLSVLRIARPRPSSSTSGFPPSHCPSPRPPPRPSSALVSAVRATGLPAPGPSPKPALFVLGSCGEI